MIVTLPLRISPSSPNSSCAPTFCGTGQLAFGHQSSSLESISSSWSCSSSDHGHSLSADKRRLIHTRSSTKPRGPVHAVFPASESLPDACPGVKGDICAKIAKRPRFFMAWRSATVNCASCVVCRAKGAANNTSKCFSWVSSSVQWACTGTLKQHGIRCSFEIVQCLPGLVQSIPEMYQVGRDIPNPPTILGKE